MKTDRLGEHLILAMLNAYLPGDESRQAAEGWGGDLFVYYERGNDYLFIWNIVWDTELDAAQFSNSFLSFMREVGGERLGPNVWKARGEYLSFKGEKLTTLIVGSTTLEWQANAPSPPDGGLTRIQLGLSILGGGGCFYSFTTNLCCGKVSRSDSKPGSGLYHLENEKGSVYPQLVPEL